MCMRILLHEPVGTNPRPASPLEAGREHRRGSNNPPLLAAVVQERRRVPSETAETRHRRSPRSSLTGLGSLVAPVPSVETLGYFRTFGASALFPSQAFGAYQLATGRRSVYQSRMKAPTSYDVTAPGSWAAAFLACTLATFAALYRVTAEDTNVLAASDWSAPVDSQARVDHPIRGRLLILSGSEPGYGGPKTYSDTMLFVELQNETGACCGSIKMWFDVMGLKLDLVDANGKPATIDQVGGWSGRGAIGGCWVVLPYNSTQRLFVNPGTKSPLRICRGGEPWDRWSIPSTDTSAYYLSGTLTVSTPTNSTFSVVPQEKQGAPHAYAEWTGTLTFPKMKISPADIAKRK